MHPHIASLYEVIRTENFLFIIMEYVGGGDMYAYVKKRNSLSEEDARPIFRHIMSAIKYSHHNRVVNRDIKLENIMLSDYGELKLIDFGLGALTQEGTLLNQFCGSPSYAAPEMFLHTKYVGSHADVWCLGVLLFELVAGVTPFTDGYSVLKGNYKYPDYFSKELRLLLDNILEVIPKKRATLDFIVQHPWMNIGFEGPVNCYLSNEKTETLDVKLVDQLKEYGFHAEDIESGWKNREYNEITTCYKLLYRKKLRLKLHEAHALTEDANVCSIM